MTDYSKTIPDSVVLERTPADSSFAPRHWEEARLLIDCGSVSLHRRQCYGGDAYTSEEWHGRTLVIDLADSRGGQLALDVARLRRDLSPGGKLAVLIERVIAGHTVKWDGNNFVGRLTEDAAEAFSDCEGPEDYTSDVEVWGAAEWLVGDGSEAEALSNLDVTIDATDAQIEEEAAALREVAARDGVLLTGSLEEAITDIISRLRDEEAAEEEARIREEEKGQ